MLPDFVIVGNIAWDRVPAGRRPGGTAVYAAAVACGLGRRVGLVTAAPTDAITALPPGVAVVRHPAATCTTFANVYTPAGRVQYLRDAGTPIPAALLPAAWTAARIVVLGPVYHEVDAATATRCAGIVGVCAQGYLRAVDADGRVRPLPPSRWQADLVLRHARALFVSEEDLAGAKVPATWTATVPLVVVTAGRRGARLHHAGTWTHIPAFPAREVDPTGAGDAFAAAFLVALDEGAEPVEAARFAAAVAALVVEGEGPVIPRRADALRRMAARPEAVREA
jgi:1D-myo-inositol 3-kinase